MTRIILGKAEERVLTAALAWAELQEVSDGATAVHSARALAKRELDEACRALFKESR